MPRPSSLANVRTLAEVQSLADLKTFARGKAYFHDGAVSRLDERDGVLRANVNGTHRYSVELGVGDDGELTYECDCPVGEDGIFCKHAVAVALSCWRIPAKKYSMQTRPSSRSPARNARRTKSN